MFLLIVGVIFKVHRICLTAKQTNENAWANRARKKNARGKCMEVQSSRFIFIGQLSSDTCTIDKVCFHWPTTDMILIKGFLLTSSLTGYGSRHR